MNEDQNAIVLQFVEGKISKAEAKKRLVESGLRESYVDESLEIASGNGDIIGYDYSKAKGVR